MSSLDIEQHDKFDIAAHSAAYNAWRLQHILVPDAIEFKCPYLDENMLGGYYVDNEYCKSACHGEGCSELKTCKPRLQHLRMRGVKNVS